MGDDGNKKRSVFAILAIAFLALASLGVWTFRQSDRSGDKSETALFDGWIYGREDQKKANIALANAGLNDFSWSRGQLMVPSEKLDAYRAALAGANAYPKAPSETRADAIREMSVFEPDSKTRMRELNACAVQLERTIGQMRGVEYATVGARSRREQSGLTFRNIVTVAVGVAFQDDRELDVDALSAITLAAKHQLGVDDVENISIIDLKRGKSFVGVENSVNAARELAVNAEKTRLEKYWRDKYLEAFSDIKNIRVSISADVVWRVNQKEERKEIAQSNSTDVQTNQEKPDYESRQGESASVPGANQVSYFTARVDGCFDSLDPKWTDFGVNENDSKKNYRVDISEGLNKVPFAESKSDSKENVVIGGCAQLGNPRNARVNQGKNRPSIWAKNVVNFKDDGARRTQFPGISLVNTSLREVDSERKACLRLFDGVVPSVVAFSNMAPSKSRNDTICQASATLPRDIQTPASKEMTLRSLVARIAIPQSYISTIADRQATSRPETFVADEADDTLYLATEERVVADTKRFAVDLLRPTGEKNGWSEDDLERWVTVTVFLDGNLAREGATNVKDETEYRTSYVNEGYDGKSSNSAAESESSIATKDGDENTTLAIDGDGVIKEVRPTVASLSSSPNESDVQSDFSIRSFFSTYLGRIDFERLRELWKSSVVRKSTIGSVIAIAFLWALIRAFRRGVRKTKQSREKVEESGCAERSRSNDLKAGRRRLYSQQSDDWEDESSYDDELERELTAMASVDENVPTSKAVSAASHAERSQETGVRKGENVGFEDYWTKREEALNLIARYPERAVSSLQKWVTNANPKRS